MEKIGERWLAMCCWKTPLELAKWMTEEGYRQLLQAECANDPDREIGAAISPSRLKSGL
jgi:hypothetical protein